MATLLEWRELRWSMSGHRPGGKVSCKRKVITYKTNHGHLVRGFVFAILKLHREICIIDTKHSCSEVVIITASEIIQIGNSMT